MKFTIHRGTKEIGGTVIELSSGSTTLLLDAGLPLSKDSTEVDVSSLKPDAVLISHPHMDHYGLIEELPPDIPIYMSELSFKLIEALQLFIDKSALQNNIRHFEPWQPFEIGDFTITPYLMDHSSPEAFAFLLEAEGKRVFYSGDLRGHGRKGVLFENLLKRPPENLDVMFLEETMMGRDNQPFPDEKTVEVAIFGTIKDQMNISFLISSSQNIDRLVSAFRACKRAGKIFVIDPYTAWVLEQMKTVAPGVPTMDWDEVKVFIPGGQYEKARKNRKILGDFYDKLFGPSWLEKEALIKDPSRFLFLGKMSSFKDIRRFMGEHPVNVIYSMWKGYLENPSADFYGSRQISEMMDDDQVNFSYAHTSGHATVEDLQRLVKAVKPKQLVPVHTERPGAWTKLADNVLGVSDGSPVEF
jgi:ribonuclease J